MKRIFFTPGPSQLFDGVYDYVQEGFANGIGSISHRSKEFEEIFKHTTVSLKKLLNIPNNFHIFFLGSATEAMERIIENCVEKRSFHFVNGEFSNRFYSTAEELKKSPEKIEVAAGQGFDFSQAAIPDNTELICFTQNETSTGVAIDMKNIYSIKKKNPDKLVAVDIVSSVPYVNVDYSLIDCTFFSVQKCFGMPAGLGVLIVNDSMIEKAKLLQNKGCNIGSYHNFQSLLKSEEKNQTPETPNALWIYLLGRICDELSQMGLDKIRTEIEQKAKILYDFFGNSSKFEPFVKKNEWRSKTVIVINTSANSKEVIDKLKARGIIVGAGYKDFKEKQIRIANFPAHKIEDVERMLEVLK